MIKLRLIIAILIGLMLVACDKVGSKAWCEKLEQKSTGSWTVDEVKAAGKPATSLALADGLLKYSERGQEYVDELKGIIRANHFDVADAATPRDEPIGVTFLVNGEEAAIHARKKYEELRKSGELTKILTRMQLE